jgi:hypothetical protein
VDAVLRQGRRKIAIHTQRVFFHRSPNPRSEIAEGIRRTDRSLDEILSYFQKGGIAEQNLGPLSGIILAFDIRGYEEIKAHLKARWGTIARAHGSRFRPVFVDELARVPAGVPEMRRELNRLIDLYQKDRSGLQKIIGGVIYSRYVGLLLELKTIEYFLDRGYWILQSGREFLDADHNYITELDAVVRSPEGKISLVEARSARVLLPPNQVLKDKILYKLDTYKKYRREINAFIGAPFEEVVFSIDVGPQTPSSLTRSKGEAEYLERQQALVEFLRAQEGPLSRRYGFPVRLLFLYSAP